MICNSYLFILHKVVVANILSFIIDTRKCTYIFAIANLSLVHYFIALKLQHLAPYPISNHVIDKPRLISTFVVIHVHVCTHVWMCMQPRSRLYLMI